MGRWMIEEAAANRFVRSAPLCIAAAGRLDPEKDPETRSLRLVALRHSLCIELSGVPGRVRSSTTIPTLSIRLSAMCPIYKVSSNLTTNAFGTPKHERDVDPERSLPRNALPADVPQAASAGSSASGVEALRVKIPYLEDRKTLEKQAQWRERRMILADHRAWRLVR